MLGIGFVLSCASMVFGRTRVHVPLGVIAFFATALSLFFLPERGPRNFYVLVFTILALLGYVFGVGVVMASSTFKRRVERHMLLCGAAAPLTLIAMVWIFATREIFNPNDLFAITATVLIAVIGGFAVVGIQRLMTKQRAAAQAAKRVSYGHKKAKKSK